MSSSSNVCVGVRVRPLSPSESQANLSVSNPVIVHNEETSITLGTRTFTYDYVFDERVLQNDIYGAFNRNMLDAVFNGYNATVSLVRDCCSLIEERSRCLKDKRPVC